MSISIVTIALNAESDIALTMESVAHQECADFEYIVVDGGSRDGTRAAIERYRFLINRYIELEDAGIFFAMNEALQYCTKDYVLFLNAGDQLYSDRVIARVAQAIQPGADVVYGSHIYVDRGTETLRRSINFTLLRDALREGELDGPWLDSIPCHQATFTSVTLLKRIGYDTSLAICADHDFMFKISNNDATFQYIDLPISFYHAGGYSSQNLARLFREWNRVYRKYSDEPQKVSNFIDRMRGDAEPGVGTHLTENLRTGVKVAGFSQHDEIIGEGVDAIRSRWCSGNGFAVLSPGTGLSAGVTITGYNPFTDQAIEARRRNGTVIGSVSVPTGKFSIKIFFEQPVDPKSVINLSTKHAGRIEISGRRYVCIAVERFTFERVKADIPLWQVGDTIAYNQENEAQTRKGLSSGWAQQEPAHIWSVGPSSILTVRLDADVRRLRLLLLGNPFLPEEDRTVAVSVNQEMLGIFALEAHVIEVEVALALSLGSGPTNIVFRPKAVQSPPNDGRKLGFGLFAIHVE